jgi:hypothetical protein
VVYGVGRRAAVMPLTGVGVAQLAVFIARCAAGAAP